MGVYIAGEVWSTIALLVVGMVVEDCLLLLLNLLKHNVSNQNYLKEGSYIQRLPSCMDIEYTDQPGGDMWSAQKVTNVHLMLEVCSHLIFLLNSHCIPTSNYYHFFSCFKIVSLCPLCQGKQFLPSASLVVREFSWDSPHWASYSLANCSSVSQSHCEKRPVMPHCGSLFHAQATWSVSELIDSVECCLQLIRTLVSPNNPPQQTASCQKLMNQCGVLILCCYG